FRTIARPICHHKILRRHTISPRPARGTAPPIAKREGGVGCTRARLLHDLEACCGAASRTAIRGRAEATCASLGELCAPFGLGWAREFPPAAAVLYAAARHDHLMAAQRDIP